MSYPSVVIVGKGSSLLNKEIGNLIDSFDVVIRVNHRPTNELYKNVGTRTSIFSSRVIEKIETFVDEIVKAKKLWVCDLVSNNSYSQILQTLNGIDITFMDDKEVEEFSRHFVGYGNGIKPNDVRFNMCLPDTGISTIFSSIKRFENSQISVCGIDLYNNGNNNIFGNEDIVSIFKMPVLLQTLYYKKMIHSGKIREI